MNPENWYYDNKTDKFLVFAFNPDVVAIKFDGKDYTVQELTAYEVNLFCIEEEGDTPYLAAYNTFLSERKKAVIAWSKLEMNSISSSIQSSLKAQQAAKRGYTKELCEQVDLLLDNMVSKPKSRPAYADYYEKIGSYFATAHQRITGTKQFEQARILSDEEYRNRDATEGAVWNDYKNPRAVFIERSRRQLGLRKLFWRLFYEKFNVTYQQFLESKRLRKFIMDHWISARRRWARGSRKTPTKTQPGRTTTSGTRRNPRAASTTSSSTSSTSVSRRKTHRAPNSTCPAFTSSWNAPTWREITSGGRSTRHGPRT